MLRPLTFKTAPLSPISNFWLRAWGQVRLDLGFKYCANENLEKNVDKPMGFQNYCNSITLCTELDSAVSSF